MDSLDNSFEYPISIGAFSPEVDAEFGLDNCVNLKREILPFAEVRQYTFYIVYDDEVTSVPVQIKWDSLDYLYEFDEFMVYQATLIAQTGYIESIDNTILGFFSRDSDNPDNVFIYENPFIDIFAENSAFECIPIDNVIKLRLDVTFKNYSLAIINQNNNNNNFKIYPNPTSNIIQVISKIQTDLTITITSITGEVIYHYSYKNIFGPLDLDLSSFEDGVYLIGITSDTYPIYEIKKIIKI